MNLISTLELNTSKKFHLNLAFFISIWTTIFLITIAPNDVEKLSMMERFFKMPIYGLILFLSYYTSILVQSEINKKNKKWTVLCELYIIIVFGLLLLIGSFLYYQSNIIRGGNNFGAYSTENFSPIFLIISFILVFLRLNYQKIDNETNDKQEWLMLRGENKIDILDIKTKNIICVFSAGNYVEVFFLEDKTLNKKLIRSTLKNIQSKAPYLKKIHRSRLINPIHILSWKDNSTLILTQMEVGVSRKFRENLVNKVTRP